MSWIQAIIAGTPGAISAILVWVSSRKQLKQKNFIEETSMYEIEKRDNLIKLARARINLSTPDNPPPAKMVRMAQEKLSIEYDY